MRVRLFCFWLVVPQSRWLFCELCAAEIMWIFRAFCVICMCPTWQIMRWDTESTTVPTAFHLILRVHMTRNTHYAMIWLWQICATFCGLRGLISFSISIVLYKDRFLGIWNDNLSVGKAFIMIHMNRQHETWTVCLIFNTSTCRQ